jgi:cyclophilin family peptidyl-prolyl cis-trans isomerase
MSILSPTRILKTIFKSKEDIKESEQREISENPRCFFDLTVDHTQYRIIVELFADKLPKTCANFLSLVRGDKVDALGRKMHFKNSVLYEMIPGWIIGGGDFVNNNGTGGESTFDGKEFDDESFAISHDQPGLLSMLSHGPNSNSSLFFVNLKPAEWLNGHYVAFARVVFGLEILQKLADEFGTQSGIPKATVRIVDCGEI